MPKILAHEEVVRRARVVHKSGTFAYMKRMVGVLISEVEKGYNRIETENSLWVSVRTAAGTKVTTRRVYITNWTA